jgi:UDP-GlcNAc:undecaprenyl-phosphate GlcNAc-1-phosphate transferase
MFFLHIGSFLAAVLLSVTLTWRIRNVAQRRRWVRAPVDGRHLHTQPLPRLGGVAIYLTTVAVAAWAILGARFAGIAVHASTHDLLWLFGTATAVFFLGLADDIFSLAPSIKLAVEVLAGLALFFGGNFRVAHFDLFGRDLGTAASLGATLVWVLLITNAFNLIDGLDGLAAGSALFSTLTIFTLGFLYKVPLLSLVTVALAGALLGFIRFNFNPATIFLGDSGSIFVGFTLSALSLITAQKSTTMMAVAIPIVSFGLPVVDTLLAVLRRFMSGKPLFAGDREHIHHKLIERGFTHRGAVVLLYGVSAVGALASMMLLDRGTGAVVLVVLGVGVFLGIQQLGYPELVELGRLAQRTMEQKRVVANNLGIRRAAQRLARAASAEDVTGVLVEIFHESGFDAFELSWLEGDGAERSFVWSRPGAQQTAAGWSLNLQLTGTAGVAIGALNLYRNYAGGALLVDVNVLMNGFTEVLADSMLRLQQTAPHSPLKAKAMHA